jgi:protein SCO1/2
MRKALILLAILVVPSVFYLVIKSGKNQYKNLAYYGPKTPVSKTVNGENIIDTLYHSVQGFSLYDADSNHVTEKITEGKIVVADFIFTTCQSICPKMSDQMMRVQHAFKDNPDVIILSFTVDPEHDTPAVLKAYADKHNAIKDKWYFLTGSKDSIYALARHSYFVTAMEGDGVVDDFVHSEQVVLVDPDKHIRGFYDGTELTEVNKLIDDITILHMFLNKEQEKAVN